MVPCASDGTLGTYCVVCEICHNNTKRCVVAGHVRNGAFAFSVTIRQLIAVQSRCIFE